MPLGDFSVLINLRTKTHARKAHAALDFVVKAMWPLNSPEPELYPLDYHVWGNVRGLLQAPLKTEDDHKKL